MTPKQQHITIAEACGICAYDDRPDYGWTLKKGVACNVPDYLNDLNAMHKVEASMTPHQRRNYPQELVLVCGIGQEEEWTSDEDWTIIHATAAQRAEAFLRTIGKWKD